MKHANRLHQRLSALFLTAALAVVACGGSDEPASPAPSPAPAPAPARQPAPAPQPAPNPLGLDLPSAGTLQGDLTLAAGSLAPAQQSLCGGVDGVGEATRLGVVVAMVTAPDGRVLFAERPKSGMNCTDSPRTRRLRVLDGERVSTLRTWTLPQAGDVVEVTALAVNGGGEVFVAQGYPTDAVFASPGYPVYRDGEAPGIWRVGADGTASLLAGHERAYRGGDAADGTGGAAVFSQLKTMVWGRDDLLYVTDFGRIRTVTAQGQVQTTTQYGTVFGGPGGRVLAWQTRDFSVVNGWLTDLLTGASWGGMGDAEAIVGLWNNPTADVRGGVYAVDGLDSSGRIVRLLANRRNELAVGAQNGGGTTELGALPARLGAVHAIAGGHEHSLYVAVEGAIVKATFDH